ncbi:MAG: NAD(P)H-dependent oxidoreductase subunit E [Candidatus Heimdallarchaeota archaeon]|nr:NAD(P)H-dependent oxidoreductase subunit E [Candidatus Heimdallarchaeota archaeon]
METTVSQILEKYNGDSSALITILNEVQETYQYLPREALDAIAKDLKISLAKIFGVVTFYSQYKLEKPGKYSIKCCHGTACYVKGATSITQTLDLEHNIRKAETTQDGVFSMEEVACLGACALAPVVEINGEIFGKLDSNKINKIITDIKEKEADQ